MIHYVLRGRHTMIYYFVCVTSMNLSEQKSVNQFNSYSRTYRFVSIPRLSRKTSKSPGVKAVLTPEYATRLGCRQPHNKPDSRKG